MFLFRFPEKIPNIFYLIYGFAFMGLLIMIVPPLMIGNFYQSLPSIQNSEWVLKDLLNIHFLLLVIVNYLLKFLPFFNIEILRVLNLVYVLFILIFSYKILKLKFYDLEIWSPLSILISSGVILYSCMTFEDYLASGLITLIIFFCYQKIFEEDNFFNNILFILFSIIALLMDNFFFLIIISIFSLIKLTSLKLSREKIFSLLSNLSFVLMIAITLIVINQINQQELFIQLNLNINNLLNKTIVAFILLLPLAGIFFIAIFFNVLKRINWNKELLFFLLMITSSLIIFIFSSKVNYAPLVFLLPLLSIYIHRTLEFTELKLSKFMYLSIFFIPFLIIYVDTSLYSDLIEIPLLNFIFYGAIILLSLINPCFVFEKQNIISSQKIVLFSVMSIFSICLAFFYYQYNKQLPNVLIPKALMQDFQCDIETTRLSSDQNSELLNYYFFENVNSEINQKCHVHISFSPLNELPISDTNSVNKTLLDVHQQLFINLNIKKL